MLRAYGESAEHFAGRVAAQHGKKKSVNDCCQRCGLSRKLHKPDSGKMNSCTGFIEAGDCTCMYVEGLGQHLHPACPFLETE